MSSDAPSIDERIRFLLNLGSEAQEQELHRQQQAAIQQQNKAQDPKPSQQTATPPTFLFRPTIIIPAITFLIYLAFLLPELTFSIFLLLVTFYFLHSKEQQFRSNDQHIDLLNFVVNKQKKIVTVQENLIRALELQVEILKSEIDELRVENAMFWRRDAESLRRKRERLEVRHRALLARLRGN